MEHEVINYIRASPAAQISIRAPLSGMEARMIHRFAITSRALSLDHSNVTRRKNEDTVEGLKDGTWIRDRRMRRGVGKGDMEND